MKHDVDMFNNNNKDIISNGLGAVKTFKDLGGTLKEVNKSLREDESELLK